MKKLLVLTADLIMIFAICAVLALAAVALADTGNLLTR